MSENRPEILIVEDDARLRKQTLFERKVAPFVACHPSRPATVSPQDGADDQDERGAAGDGLVTA